MNQHKFISTLIVLFGVYGLHAKQFDVYVRVFDADDGLPSPEVYDVHSDSMGYLWFCTDRGIARYNGYEFETFGTDNSALTTNTVFKVFEAPNGNLWFTCYDATVVVYDIKKQDFFHYSMPQFPPGIKRGWVQTILFSNSEVCLFFTDGDQVVTMNLELPNEVNLIDYDDFFGEAIHEPSTGFSFQLARNNLPVVKATLNGEQRISEIVLHQKEQKENLVFFFDRTVFTINGKRPEVKQTYNSIINYLHLDALGQLYALTRQGVIEIGQEGGINNFLNGVSVTGVCTDLDGNTWFSTIQQGVLMVPDFSIRRSNLHALAQGKEQGLCLSQSANHLLVGTSMGNIYTLNQHQQIQCFLYPYNDLKPVPTNVLFSENERVYTSKGHYLDPVKDGLKLESITQSVSGDVNFLYPAGQDTFLSIGLFQGYRILYKSAKGYEQIVPTQNVGGRVHDIQKDDNGTYWMATQTGVWTLEPNDLTVPKRKTRNTWLNGRVNQIEKLNNGNLVFATVGHGMSLLSESGWSHLGTNEGLPSNLVHCVEQTANNEVWLGTNKGIAQIQYDYNDQEWRVDKTLTATDGLIASYIRDMEFWNNRLWMVSEEGVFSLDPHTKRGEIRAPETHILKVASSRKVYQPSTIDLSADETQLKVSYLALCYTQPDRGFYQYKLDGDVKGDWLDVDERNVYLMNLLPGPYTFQVRARSKQGPWGKAAVMQFYIPTVFWKTAVFKLLVIAIIFLVIAVVFRWRLLEFRNRMAQQKKLGDLELKFKEAELSALRSQMNPHFVFNALNSIQRYIVTQQPEVAGDYLVRFGKLIRNSLKYSKLDMIDLEEEVQFLSDYFEIEQHRFPSRFSYQINLAETVKPRHHRIPPLILQPLCENAIKHAFGGGQQNGKVVVCLKLIASNSLKVVIQDNGTGIYSTGTYSEVNEPYGLNIVGNRIKLLQDLGYSASMHIEDLSETTELTGTRIELILPSE